MDIAVLSDIHGNYVSLQSCIDYALKKDINTFFFLGDYLGELPYPEKTMDMILEVASGLMFRKDIGSKPLTK